MGIIRIGAISLLVANMIGAGIFALPYLLHMTGWGTFLIYLIALGILLTLVHGYYGEALDRVRGEHRLTGLVKLYLPQRVFGLAAFSILGGLLLTMVAYIILGATFLTILFPGISLQLSMGIMWVLGSFPLFLRLKRFIGLEFMGSVAMAVIIIFILLMTKNPGAIFHATPFIAGTGNKFLPFGPILFALAGWTAIGPMREYERKIGAAARPKFSSIAWGTVIVVLLYIFFAVGMVGSAPTISPDTLSGLEGWSPFLMSALALLGLIAIWTSYAPVAEEARDTFVHDFRWQHVSATMFVLLLPIVFIMLGFTNFFAVVSFAGGVFLALQYIFIAFVSKSAVRFGTFPRLVLNATVAVFFAAAIYEVYRFIVG